MLGSIWIYRLYDVAEEIDLVKAEEILSQRKKVSRLRLLKVRPKSISFKDPPISMNLESDQLMVGPYLFDTKVTARIYDLGVITVTLRLILPQEMTYEELIKLAVDLSSPTVLQEVFEGYLQTVRNELSPALIKGAYQGFVEDFLVYYFKEWDPNWDPVPLLLAEEEQVSEEVRQETLQHTYKYTKDWTTITWDTAIVCDPTESSDIPDLLEFANAQLLELRYYDNVLEKEIEGMYDAIEEADQGNNYRRLSKYRHITKQLLELVADITAIKGRIENSLRVTQDVFYARIYAAALKVLRVKEWAESIDQKVSIIERTYSMLSEEVESRRLFWLEAAIVILIAFEIIIWLFTL
ncbi:MAG: hypothetical protein H0Z39_02130 [Peptococcaceae bacterium]|nr:hypothetical protein [Peptococcaceae bacterium]